MIAVWKWKLSQFRRKIWYPISLYAVGGGLTAIAAVLAKPLVPDALVSRFGTEAAPTILAIMASSMLAVTTFSLSILTSALASAASGATPRATALTKEDGVARQVLASFVGAFIFSLMGIIGLQSGIYQPTGRVVLFFTTLVVLAAVVWQLVRWIAHLTDFGRLPDTIARVERAAIAALSQRMEQPFLGARPLDDSQVPAGQTVFAEKIGYVQMVDTAALEKLAVAHGWLVSLHVIPGAFVHKATRMLTVSSGAVVSPDLAQGLRDCLVIGIARTFDQDPRFGVLTLTEIASRALSPAVNDPGTAIDILGRQVRVLTVWAEKRDVPVSYPHVCVPALRLNDLMADAFAPIARDGAGLVEVQIRLHKMLLALAQQAPAFGPVAVEQSRRALTLAEAALTLPEDKAVLQALHRDLATVAQAPPL